MRSYYVYIVTNRKHGTLYIGMTGNLAKRAYEHKSKVVDGFTNKHGLDRLVYFEAFDDPETAIRREKRLKEWQRTWKITLIEKTNPEWNDLYAEMNR